MSVTRPVVRFLARACALGVVLATAAPLAAQRAIVNPSNFLTVTRGSSALLVNPVAFERYAVGEPDIAQAVVVSPSELLINGKSVGSTSLVLWDKAGEPRLYSIEVAPDVASLQRFLRDMLPGESISVQSNGKAVVLSGTVRDATVVSRAVEAAKSSGATVIDNLSTPPAVQVLLKVRFAEVSRSALKELSFAFNGANVDRIPSNPMDWAGGANSSDGIVDFLLGNPTLGAFVEGQISAQITKGNIKSLAEPNLLTLPGKEATFLAGGEFPFPVVQGGATGGGGATGAVTIEFKEFGVKLTFTPTIMRNGGIRLKVAPEVSTLDFANGLQFQGYVIPLLLTRRAEAEVELMEGQYLALAGLLDQRTLESVSKIPLLGDIPIIGELFKSRQKRQEQTELLVLISPRLVRGQDKAPELPTREPGTWDWSGWMRDSLLASPLRKADGSWRDTLPVKCLVADPAKPACGSAPVKK
jgi:pilus assembly protein CpaC